MRTVIFCTLFLLSLTLFAQGTKLKNQAFSFSMGFSDLSIDKFPLDKNLDFINYIESYPEYLDYITVTLGYKFDFFSRMSADIKLILMDDIVPDNYDISVYYYINHWLGIGAGSMLNKVYISDFEEYQIKTLPGYYIVDDNVQQFTTYDLGFYLTPAIKIINTDIFSLLIRCDLGLSSFLKKKATFYHKKVHSNERLQYHYKTTPTFQPYIQPKVEIQLRAFRIKQTAVGILLNTSYFHSNKSINYVRDVQNWTPDNSTQEYIHPPKHDFSRFEFSSGIFLSW